MPNDISHTSPYRGVLDNCMTSFISPPQPPPSSPCHSYHLIDYQLHQAIHDPDSDASLVPLNLRLNPKGISCLKFGVYPLAHLRTKPHQRRRCPQSSAPTMASAAVKSFTLIFYAPPSAVQAVRKLSLHFTSISIPCPCIPL